MRAAHQHIAAVQPQLQRLLCAAHQDPRLPGVAAGQPRRKLFIGTHCGDPGVKVRQVQQRVDLLAPGIGRQHQPSAPGTAQRAAGVDAVEPRPAVHRNAGGVQRPGGNARPQRVLDQRRVCKGVGIAPDPARRPLVIGCKPQRGNGQLPGAAQSPQYAHRPGMDRSHRVPPAGGDLPRQGARLRLGQDPSGISPGAKPGAKSFGCAQPCRRRADDQNPHGGLLVAKC